MEFRAVLLIHALYGLIFTKRWGIKDAKKYNHSLIRVCLPMFTFAFDEVLFRFQYERPAFEPLFQFPPT
jgi:hypothetical protein